ncbi:anti-sigma regulatory factor (Ser/Thr protein kinase) [Luteimonas cucumeris]|uniref:Anti-sigma regulatory factor (Ser/Thr protein kinase) n=1 Tax=Luteimonas cucumeris TaxID=985012 RepID=A0A562LEM1_9GAMM|nr:ATP-binding protein [Luteimonas cucumeris]TWI05954.1 anti-sigma regulatory factor (Ser/Thr protein kinase) [Luteimonas cucumeris]
MHLQIAIPNQREHLRELADAIDAALLAQGVDRALRDDVRLVAEEVACNVVEHGYDAGAQGEVLVAIERRPGALAMEFRDDGRPFDPLAVSPPLLDADIDQRPLGGLGLHLVRELAQSLSYAREEPYNVLRVTLRDPALGH